MRWINFRVLMKWNCRWKFSCRSYAVDHISKGSFTFFVVKDNFSVIQIWAEKFSVDISWPDFFHLSLFELPSTHPINAFPIQIELFNITTKKTFCFQTQSLKVIKSCHKSINRTNFDWKSGHRKCKRAKKTLSMNELIIFHSVITLQTGQRRDKRHRNFIIEEKFVPSSLWDR